MLVALDVAGPWIKYEELGDFAFILAHEWTRKTYRDHYLQRRDKSFAMVDHGVYELTNPVEFKQYTDVIKDVLQHYKAVVYVLPDILRDPRETERVAETFLTWWSSQISSAEPMFVCQTVELSRCIDFCRKRHVDWVGLPIWMDREVKDVRVLMSTTLAQRGLKVHLLGLDRYFEVASARYATSVDTSLPLTLAKNGVYVIDPMWSYRLPRISWTDPVPSNDELVKTNIEMLKQMARNQIVVRVAPTDEEDDDAESTVM